MIQGMYVSEHFKKNLPADATQGSHSASDNQHHQKDKNFN